VFSAIADHSACKQQVSTITAVGCATSKAGHGRAGHADVAPDITFAVSNFLFAASENSIVASVVEIAAPKYLGCSGDAVGCSNGAMRACELCSAVITCCYGPSMSTRPYAAAIAAS